MDPTGLDGLTPETLTEENALHAWEALREMAKARHAAIAERSRGLSLQGFCVCGYATMGRGGELCRDLRALAKGAADEGEWLTKARALRDSLAAKGCDR